MKTNELKNDTIKGEGLENGMEKIRKYIGNSDKESIRYDIGGK